MSNARIQFSSADDSKWTSINPKLREGELVFSKTPLGKYKAVVGAPGGSNYKDSILLWDEAAAEKLTADAQSAAAMATQKATEATQQAEAATAVGETATTKAAEAASSANSAADSASAASGYASTATAKATAAANSASAAASSESNAAASAAAAVQKATAAATSAETAAAKATAAADSVSAANDSAIIADRQATAAANSAIAAAASASEATAKVIEATDEANRAKAEADRAKSISDTIGNPVSDVTENNGSVTVTKSDGTQSTFMAFPQGENGALPIANGGTGATTDADARTNLGLNKAVTGATISGKVITLTFADGTTKTLTTQDNGYHTGNATSIGGASATKPAVVVQSYNSDASWYRVWSDGWVEQGGRCKANTTITYSKAFANTNYIGFVISTNTSNYSYSFGINNRSTTSGKMAYHDNGYTGQVDWYVCGKGA